MSRKKRATGYYWVMLGEKWIIAKYLSPFKGWYISGSPMRYTSSEFNKITKDRIIPPQQ